MSKHLTTRQIEGYRQRTLEPAELLALDDHLTECPVCRRQMREATGSRSAILTLQQNLLDAAAAQPGLWRKIADLFSPMTLRLAGVVALLILSSILALRNWEGKRDDIAITPSPPPASPTPQPSITPSPDTLLALNDGGRQVKLDAQGNLTGLESLSPADLQRVKTALTTQQVETPGTLRELKSASGAVMGSPPGTSFALLSPVGLIVPSDRPTLHWQPLRGAIGYQVTITDPKANYKEVAVSPALSDAKWTVDHPLKRGRVYTWQVTARTESGEVKAPALDAPEAKFRVLERVMANELVRAEKAYSGSHLTLGLLYAQAGLLDDAEREFQALVKANPESVVAKNLLRDVRAKRRAR